MSVLYRKYRPQAFADVVGQAHVTRTLAHAIATGRVVHAYLFSGSRGVGKTTTARLLAKAVNCEVKSKKLKVKSAEESEVPCNSCDPCTAITDGRCVDVVEIDAASHTGVDHVREHIIDVVRIAPARARRKVFIIDEVHMLSASAFNALLKTLEEPPAHALFILATTELHRVPETIRSRCQHFAFRRVALPELEHRIRDLAAREGVAVEDSVVASVASAADGSVRDAESMLGQLLALGGKRIGEEEAWLVLPRSSVSRAAELVSAMERRDCAAALAEVRCAEEEGFDAEAYVRDIIALLRDAMVAEIADAQRVAARVAALRIFSELLEHIGRSDHPFFALEVAVLQVAAGNPQPQAPSPKPQADRGVPPPASLRGSTLQSARSNPSVPRRVHAEMAVPASSPGVEEERSDGKTPGVRRAVTSADSAVQTALPQVSQAELLTHVRSIWSGLVAKLAEVNAALPYLLEGGRPQRIADGVLTIGFRYRLHAEKVKQPESSTAIADAVHALLGTELRITTAVVGVEEFRELDVASRPQTGDAVADAALEVFGGRVVE